MKNSFIKQTQYVYLILNLFILYIFKRGVYSHFSTIQMLLTFQNGFCM